MNSNVGIKVLTCELLGSWPSFSKIPRMDLPEIALLGRSNVGKSTFVNKVLSRKALARVSGTPGKTREAVLFKVEYQRAGEKHLCVLTDLPGFGYARVGKEDREKFHGLLAGYVSKRANLEVLCLLNDCRREPAEDEELLWNAAKDRGLSRVLVLTKADKLNRSEQANAQKLISKKLQGAESVLLTGSDTKGEGLLTALISSLNAS